VFVAFVFQTHYLLSGPFTGNLVLTYHASDVSLLTSAASTSYTSPWHS